MLIAIGLVCVVAAVCAVGWVLSAQAADYWRAKFQRADIERRDLKRGFLER